MKRNALLLSSCCVLLHLNLVQGAKAKATHGSSRNSVVEKRAGPKGSGALHGLDQHKGAHCGALSAKDKDASCYEVSKQR